MQNYCQNPESKWSLESNRQYETTMVHRCNWSILDIFYKRRSWCVKVGWVFTPLVPLSPPADDQFDESEDLSSVRHQTFLYTPEQKQGHIGITNSPSLSTSTINIAFLRMTKWGNILSNFMQQFKPYILQDLKQTECSKKILGLNLCLKESMRFVHVPAKKLSCGTSTMDRCDPRKGGQSSWLQIWWNLLRGKEATKHPYCPRFFRSFLPPQPQGGGSSCLSRLSACDMSDLSHCRAPSCLLAKLTKENSHQTLLIIIETFNTVNKSICCGPQQDREYPLSMLSLF